MSKVTEIVWKLAEPIVKDRGCEIWDVEYVKEAGDWHLRLYIDREEGVSINHCEAISRALDPILDEEDPIPESYIFEVSSAGMERTLKRPSDFERFMENYVEVKLYKNKDGKKIFCGYLMGYDNGNVTIKEKNSEDSITFEKNEVASVRLRIE